MKDTVKLFLPLFFIVMLFFSCSSSKVSMYTSEYPLTSERASAKNSSLSVQVPKGWYLAEDNENFEIDLWLVKDDLTAAVSFIPLIIDEWTKQELKENSINKLISYSKAFRKAKLGNNFKDLNKDEIFNLDNRNFGAYEYTGQQGNTNRVIIFKYGGIYYEAIASVKAPSSLQIFQVQNSILTSLK